MSGTKRNTVHLPKLQLPIFSGDVFKFREFYEIFKASIDASHLSAVEKFAYLRENVQGVAKECIAGLELCSANYPVALGILKERFGNTLWP